MFVFDRWQQIANDHEEGVITDEGAHDQRWDECTQKDMDEFRRRASAMVSTEVSRLRALAFVERWWSTTDPGPRIVKGLGWMFMEALRGFVGAVGILIFGLIFLWAVPSVTKAFRSAIDDIAPAETRPDNIVDPMVKGNSANNLANADGS